jgi:hypothetical protein
LFVLLIRPQIIFAGFSILLLDLGRVNEENKTKNEAKAGGGLTFGLYCSFQIGNVFKGRCRVDRW